MSLKYEPASEPQHISVKWWFATPPHTAHFKGVCLKKHAIG